MKKRNVYRLISILGGILLVVVTAVSLWTNYSTADGAVLNALMLGMTFLVVTLAVFFNILVFILTKKRE